MGEVEGQIVRLKHDAESNRYGFMLNDGEWYSQFLRDDMDKDFIETVKGLKEGDNVCFKFETNKKGFKNFTSVDKIIQQRESFDDEPTNGGDRIAPRLTWNNRDLTELIRIACNNANANVIKIQEKAEKPIDPKDILQLIDDFTHFWFNIELVLWHRE